ncbi:MAG: protein-glutamate O-methyltransferase CheR [Desulfobacteraceae bacterium]|jgi:chemotaxis protein methyltransferase CheR
MTSELPMSDLSGESYFMKMTVAEFERIRDLVSRHFGIRLPKEKKTLVISRLQGFLIKNGFKTFSSYLDQVEMDRSGRELSHLIDRIATNHTFFFREQSHFDFFLNTALPEIEKRLKGIGSNDLRLWSAGCSGGDEAYSFVICLMEYFADDYHKWNAGILATDISGKMLKEARAGIYPEKRMSELPNLYTARYFKKINNETYEIRDELKREVTFRRLNLKNTDVVFKGLFDVISCRNVMIYFDQAIKDQVVRFFYAQTRPGGYLFVGHSESLNRRLSPYEYVQPGVYRKAGHR